MLGKLHFGRYKEHERTQLEESSWACQNLVQVIVVVVVVEEEEEKEEEEKKKWI